jgi:cephalosporin hydroxylase
VNRWISTQITRVIGVLRPAPRLIPLDVDGLLAREAAMQTVDRFRDLYYSSGTPGDLSWCGVPILKNPCDLWQVVELIQRLKPVLLIETGTHHGGSALFYADIARCLGIATTVLTIDLNPKWSVDPRTRGIQSLVGLSTEDRILRQVAQAVTDATTGGGHVFVTLDSDHSRENVLDELRAYAGFVTRGSYVVVEDTNVNGHPSFPEHGPGPFEAVEAFLRERDDFVVDRDCERFLLTFNPSGWLRRL